MVPDHIFVLYHRCWHGRAATKGKALAVIPGRKFACLTYHAIGERTGQYTLGKEQLRNQLALLKAEAYTVEGFEQLEGRLLSKDKWPNTYVVLTFDDGHESAMWIADVLEEYGYQATFFLTRDRSLSRSGYIRGPQIRDLRRRGFSLGTHGTTHRKLTLMAGESCIDELKGSKQWLEDLLGERVRYMAFPGGYTNARVSRLAHEHGYVLTGTCKEWMNSAQSVTLPGSVNRVNIRRNFSTRVFRYVVEGHPEFYLWRQVRATALWLPKQVLSR